MNENPFTDLPAALVQEIIEKSQAISTEIVEEFRRMQLTYHERREQLQRANLIRRENELAYQTPTSCGVDGAFGVERLLAFDMVAAAAVAMEGLTPPSETRYWPDPRHYSHVTVEAHSADTSNVVRALMLGMEYILARQAPHEVVLIDGSFTTAVIYFNQALNVIADSEEATPTSEVFLDNLEEYLASYLHILRSERSDKNFVAAPKYTVLREIGNRLHWPEAYDDRAMLSDLLTPGEFTRPQPLQQPKTPWHISKKLFPSHHIGNLIDEIVGRLQQIEVLYYRPNSALPALRLEVSRATASNQARLASVIYAVKHQCSSPSILEPYPLYMADRMAKSLSNALPAFRQIMTQYVSEDYEGDISDVFINLHGYRTEAGR